MSNKSRTTETSVRHDSLDSISEEKSQDEEKLNERRKKVAVASRRFRARRKLELEDMRKENSELKKEHSDLLTKISLLEETVKQGLGKKFTIEDLGENKRLKGEIERQRSLMKVCLSMLGGYPNETNAKRNLCKEGTQSAHNYLLTLLNESQSGWTPAKLSGSSSTTASKISTTDSLSFSGFSDSRSTCNGENDSHGLFQVQGFNDMKIRAHYQITNKLFGEKQDQLRFNFRLDCEFPAPADLVAECLRNMLVDYEAQRNLWTIEEKEQLEVKSLDKDDTIKSELEELKENDFYSFFSDTHVLHQVKKTLDQDVLFIVNKKKTPMAKSSLIPPKRMNNSKSLVKESSLPQDFDNADASSTRESTNSVTKLSKKDVGVVEVHTVAVSSNANLNAILSKESLEELKSNESCSPSKSHKLKRLRGKIVQGAFVYEDIAKQTSTPQNTANKSSDKDMPSDEDEDEEEYENELKGDEKLVSKVIFISSSPADWRMIDAFSDYKDLVEKEGVLSENFSAWLSQMINKFQVYMVDTMLSKF